MGSRYITIGNGPGLVASAAIPFFVTWFFTCIRVYIRRWMLKTWKAEDWFNITSQIFFSALCFCALMATFYGNGQHMSEVLVHLEDAPMLMKYWYASEILYAVTSLLIRLAFGSFLLRICTSKIHIWIIRTALFLMSLVTIIYGVMVVIQCTPINHFWLQFNGHKGKCYSVRTNTNFTIMFSTVAASCDILFGVLPIFLIWKLNMNRRTKIIAGALMALGIITGLSVIVRIFYVIWLTIPGSDATYVTSRIAIWSLVEPAVGLVCMAITTMRPLFKSLAEVVRNTSSRDPMSPTKSAMPTPKVGVKSSWSLHRFEKYGYEGSIKSNASRSSDPYSNGGEGSSRGGSRRMKDKALAVCGIMVEREVRVDTASWRDGEPLETHGIVFTKSLDIVRSSRNRGNDFV